MTMKKLLCLLFALLLPLCALAEMTGPAGETLPGEPNGRLTCAWIPASAR